MSPSSRDHIRSIQHCNSSNAFDAFLNLATRCCYRSHADNQHADGRKERVQFDKITARVSRLCYGLDTEHVDSAAITMKVISGVYQGVTTIELDNLVGLA